MSIPSSVQIHPVVLLSVVDHFKRINKDVSRSRRVVGLLLGTNRRNVVDGKSEQVVDITTAVAVPFEEERGDPNVWFMDMNYAEEMWHMHRKVQSRIAVLGWYSSSPAIMPNDLGIHLLVNEKFPDACVFGLVNAESSRKGLPFQVYTTTTNETQTSAAALNGEGTKERTRRDTTEFRVLPSKLGTVEAEKIGVDQLLRDVADDTSRSSTLTARVEDRRIALQRMEHVLHAIGDYLEDTHSGVIVEASPEVLEVLQDLVNLLPKIHRLKNSPGMRVATNDQALITFVAAASRTTISLYDVLINRREHEQTLQSKRKEVSVELEEES